MLNSFPWANCHGKAGNMVTEVKSDTRCMETPVDFEQAMLASYSVQQESVAPGNCYPLSQKAYCPVDNETTFVYVPEKFVKYILNEESTATKSNSEIESALVADSSSAGDNSLDHDQETQPLIVDCGATTTLTTTLMNMSNVSARVIDIQLAGKGSLLRSSHIGDKTYYVLDVTGSVRPITTRAFYVKELQRDLLGGRALVNADYRIILDKNTDISGVYPVINGNINELTRIQFSPGNALFCLQSVKMSATKFAGMDGYSLWHRRFAHADNDSIRKSIPYTLGLEVLQNKTFDQHSKCAACMVGKATLCNHPVSKERAANPLERVYMDSFSSSIPSFEGYIHALVFIDDATGYRWIYGMRTKDEAYQVVQTWYSDISSIRSRYPLIQVCRDNAGEHTSCRIKQFFESVGTQNYWSTPYEPWQNGAAEGSVRSIMLCGRAVMAESGCCGKFWFRAAVHGKDARNVTYSSRIDSTPHMKMFGKPKDVSSFKAFGCECYMYLNKERRQLGKHTARGQAMIHMGFSSDDNTSGWKLYDPVKNKFYISNQVRFNEQVFPMRSEEAIAQHADSSLSDILVYQTRGIWIPYDRDASPTLYSAVKHDRVTDELILRRTDKDNTFCRTTHSEYLKDMLAKQYAMLSETTQANRKGWTAQTTIDYDRPPRSYRDAMSRMDREEWLEAYRTEEQGFKDRDVFAIVVPPPNVKILGTTTVCDYKKDSGVFQKRKVRMCVRGDQQVEGVDYLSSDLYSPTVKASEVRLLTAIAAEHGATIYKTDTRQAFLYGSMGDEDIYVRPPDWWGDPIPEGHVFKLQKAMYGTKQAARRWHICLSDWMISHEYEAINSEKTIFIKRDGDDFIIHAIFVDDLKSITANKRLMDEFLELYGKDFDITGGEPMETFIGLQFIQSDTSIRINLDYYIEAVLEEYQKFDTRVLRGKQTPVQSGVLLSKDDSPAVPDPKRQSIYRSLVAKLQFAATWVRYDIAYAVAQLGRFCASAGPTHWAALRHLMCYLSEHTKFQLRYPKNPTTRTGLDGYCDSDWANNETRRSTTGNLFRYNGCPISWKSKLQKTISLSTAEAEYYSASTATTEGIWLRDTVRALGFARQGPTPLYEDNTACIEWGNNVIGGRERAKHIDIRKHYAYEAIQLGHVRLVRVSTANQLADVLTKGLPPLQHRACIAGIQRRPWPS